MTTLSSSAFAGRGNGMLARGPVTIQYDKNGLAVKKLSDYTIAGQQAGHPTTDRVIEDANHRQPPHDCADRQSVAVGQRVDLHGPD